MADAYRDANAVNSLLLEGSAETLNLATAIFEDPYYGLNDFNNYIRWAPLLENANP